MTAKLIVDRKDGVLDSYELILFVVRYSMTGISYIYASQASHDLTVCVALN